MSRWEHWSNSSTDKKGFDSFLKENNPSAAMGPAERAKALGLQSNGKGGYIDPTTGQLAARTVNGELIFYDTNSPDGGAVSDGEGGQKLVQQQPSWADPLTGMLTTPPANAETPSEIAAIPDPVPATAPEGYNSFMQKKKQAAYQQNQVDPQPARMTPDEAEEQEMQAQQGDPAEGQAFAAEGKTFRQMFEDDNPKNAAKNMAAGYERNKEKILRDSAEAAKKRAELRSKGPIGTLPAEMSKVVNPTTSFAKDQLVSAGRAQAGTAPQPAQTDNVQTAAQPSIEVGDDSIEDTTDKDLDQYNSMIGKYREGMGPLTARVNANADKRYGRMREALSNIQDPDKRKMMLNAIALAHSYTGRINSGSGKNALGQVDHELLIKNEKRLREGYNKGDTNSIKEFVESTRTRDVSQEEIEAFFDILPTSIQNNFMGAGKISDKYENHYLGEDEEGNPLRGRLTGKQANGMTNKRLRGLMVTKLLLQQGLKDGYTGEDLDLNATDLEHVMGFNNTDNGDPTDDDFLNRENINNFVLTASNKNQNKLDSSMDYWYDNEVHKLDEFTSDDFQKRTNLFGESNSVNDVGRTLGELFLNEDGSLRDDASSQNFESYARRDREMSKDINSRISKFAKDKNVSLSKVKGRLGYELVKKLGLGAYMTKKSGRGNQGKLDDKIYTAFVSTLMDAKPEDRGKIADMWREGRKLGSEGARSENNDGAAKRILVSHLIKNGGISRKFLEDKEFKRIIKEELNIDVIF